VELDQWYLIDHAGARGGGGIVVDICLFGRGTRKSNPYFFRSVHGEQIEIVVFFGGGRGPLNRLPPNIDTKNDVMK
jgi:hypothetical protein